MKSEAREKAIQWMGPALAVLALLAMAIAFPVAAGVGNNDNPGVLPVGSNAYGMSYGEWAAEWWKWAYSIPPDVNPVNDPTGEHSGEGQSGPVWFLAGSFGSDTVTRDSTIPAGKALFFPIVNAAWVNLPEDPPFDEETVRELLASVMDTATNLTCEIDGVPVENIERYRGQSSIFVVEVPEDNLLGEEPGTYGPSVDAGYYLMLAPLSVGEHTLHFTGSLTFFGLNLDVMYNLTVVGGQQQ